MAFIIKDRIKEGTTTTGTGDITLGGSPATFESFQSYMTNGDTTYYAIVHTASGVDEWEVGLGTWNTGNTLTRTTVLAGSSGTSAVNFSTGTKDIFMTYPAAHAALAGDDVTFDNITVTGTVDGRDVSADGTKLDTVEQNADVTDAVNVAAAGALMKSGGTMTGALILNADPTTALGAATKEYVDTIAAAGIHYHTPVRVETPSALTATYDNGTSGVGATLTNSGTQAALVIDGVTVATNDRVLVYNQTNAAHNGIYTVTNTGSASSNWVLTRATDADSYGASDPDAMGEGDAFFVKEGDTGAGELYVMNTSGTITFGTTAINFTVIAETAVYSAGTGITLTGTTFSIGQDVATTANVTFNQVTAAIIGNVTGNVTGDVSGNAGTATKLATARTVQLSGDVTGSASFDGSANINITAAVTDDSHAHVISNVDGLQTALDGKVPTSRTITAGNGLTGGGDLTANRTIDIDSSYTGFDGRYVNVTGDTMTGQLVIDHNSSPMLKLQASTGGPWAIELGRDDATNSKVYNAGGYWAFEHEPRYYNGGSHQKIFHDGYHPNADKWTTARTNTVTLSGDVTGTGSASVDGTGNWTVSITADWRGGTADTTVNMNDNNISNIGKLNFINHEGSDYGVTGDVMFDENFYNDTEYGSASIWPGANGGGLAVYNQDGWGRILTDRNMKWANGNFAGMTIGASSAAPHNAGGLQISNTTNNEKIVMSGSADPYIRWQEGTTDRAYIQWNASQNALSFRNQETDNFDFYPDGTTGAVNIRLRGTDDDTWGSLYGADNSGSNQIGLLDGDQNWTYKITNDSSHEWLINNTSEMSLSTSTLDLKNNTITNVEDIYLNDRIYHNGDTDTYLQFEANDVFRIVIAGSELQEWGNNYTRLNDNDTLRLGSSSDLQMWHNGSHHYFRNYNHSNGNFYFQGENTGGSNHALVYMYTNTSRTYVSLYENSQERLRTTSTGVTVYGDLNSTSDIRYKKNVETIDNAVDKVKALRGVTFDWDNEAFEASGEEVQKPSFTDRATGVIAQDVEKVLPEAVREDAETGFKNVSYGNMVGLLIEAIKEQQEQIDMLTQKLNEMENK